MTLDLRPLDDALARLDEALGDLPTAVSDTAVTAEAEARRAAELVASLRLPNLSIDTSQLGGIQIALALLNRLDGFPEEMQKSQSEVIRRVGAFDAAIGQVSELSERCEELLEQRRVMLEELREAVAGLTSQLGDDIEKLVSDAGETLTESFADRLAAEGAQVFSDLEELVRDVFEDVGDRSKASADKLDSAAGDAADEFAEKGKALLQDVIEARARELVEAQLAEVIEDLAVSQTIATATQQINTAIASAAPNIVVALKAMSAVRRLLELAKL